MFMMGMIFSAQFGMASIYGTAVGLSVAQISIFISAIFLGGMVLQFPIGWISDWMDRRLLILFLAAAGTFAGLVGWAMGGVFEILLIAGFLMGGISNPLYALLIAYTNDYLEVDDMPAASGGLIFLNGMGAILGPVLTGWMMGLVGPSGFWLYMAAVMCMLALYVAYRMTQRASAFVEEEDYDAVSYAPVVPTGTAIAVGAAQEYYAENAGSDTESDTPLPKTG